MIPRVFFVGALVMAFAAGAQDIPFDPNVTQDCLANTEPTEAASCVGRSSQSCIETPDGGTTVGMGFCFQSELAFWDARLNVAYGALMEIEKAQDSEVREMGAGIASMAEALRAMQRAWISYRDAACDYERSQWGGGTGGGPAAAECIMRMTGLQALALETRLGWKRDQ